MGRCKGKTLLHPMRSRLLTLVVLTVCCPSAADLVAQPSIPAINTKTFAVDCRRLQGDSARGFTKPKVALSGFTIVLNDAAHRYYNTSPRAGLRYWVVRGDVPHLLPTHKAVVAFGSRSQQVQSYGALQQGQVYTIFITHGDGKAPGTAARTVIKARKCLPYVEPGVIPNELRHDRPKPLA
jgi:hypothetical protein